MFTGKYSCLAAFRLSMNLYFLAYSGYSHHLMACFYSLNPELAHQCRRQRLPPPHKSEGCW